jgi:hypothetical protein
MSSKILQMVSSWTKETSVALKKVMRNIYENVPSDRNKESYYYFLRHIQKFDEEHIRYGIRVFNNGNHHKQGKGFAFLRAIIGNRQANFSKQLSNERTLYGTAPTKRKLN